MGLFPKTSATAPVPGGGVPGRVFKLDQPPGSLCAPPRTEHNSDPGGRELDLPQVPPVWHVCVTKGPQQPAHDNILMPPGIEEEAVLPSKGGRKVGG